MRVRITKSFASSTWDVSENEVAEVSDEFGKELIREGIAVPELEIETAAIEHRRNSTQRIKKHVPVA